MCTTRSAKPVQVSKETEKKVQVLRNPYLDGIDPMIRARQTGVGSLRIDRDPPMRGSSGSARIARTTPTTGASPAVVSLAINRTA